LNANHKQYLKWLLLGGMAGFCGVIMVAAAAYMYLAPQLPSAETYRTVQLETPLRIYTADNRLIDEIGNRRQPLEFEQIPEVMRNAVIASEDPGFYSHPGVDIRGLMRGFWGFIRGVNLGGGSTITMQLANNISFDNDNVYLRKFKEIPFALQIQRELSKEEILTLYLNLIYFGAGADGIGAAAFIYYGKEASELTLPEAAMMVSLLPCPSPCNPLADPDRALERRNRVLDRMRDQGMIDQQQYAVARAAPVTAGRHGRNIEVPAPFIAEMVRQQLYEEFGEETYTQGFEVVTSIDGDKQLAAKQALVSGLEEYYDKRHGFRGVDAHYESDEVDPTASWLQELAAIPVYGNQQPGIVAEVSARDLRVLLKSGQLINVGWEQMRWARPFISRNNAWPPPQSASDIAAVGDLIRVKQMDGQWHLGQIPDVQGAVVSVSPTTGEIMALVGGYDFGRSQVNRALTPRPPGSNFKPFVYGAALEQGYSASTTINDAPITRSGYRPNNYDNTFMGPITLRYALQDSRNVPAVRLFDQVGSEAVLDFAAKLGIQTAHFPRGDLTVALGSQDVPPLELVTAYAAIANGGFRVDPWFVREIRNIRDGVIYQFQQVLACDADCNLYQPENPELPVQKAERIVDPRVAFILNSMLRSVVVEGSGRGVQRALNRSDLMGKTGTTNGPAELWFSGFNRDIATTVFVGFDQPEPLGESEQGATVAVPIWIDYMSEALADMPERTMARPDGLVDRLVEKTTGRPARPGEPNTVFEYFRAENAPEAIDSDMPGLTPDGEDNEVSIETLF
jgi:penicillin-binding protein 1A